MSEKKLSISVIVPAYNAEKNLHACLSQIMSSIDIDDEVIVVNDASLDSTKKIAQSFNCQVVDLVKNGGAAQARNHGMMAAKKDLLVFVDSDVWITKKNIEEVRNYFLQHQEVQTITANVEPDLKSSGFLTDFKNLYMSYIISDGPTSVNYVYGSFCATRRESCIAWPEQMRLTEDSLWGYNQTQQGQIIHSLKTVKVQHLKSYTLQALLKNDFLISSYFMRAFLDFNRWGTLYSKENFGHTSKVQKLSVILAIMSLVSSPLNTTLSVTLVGIWMVLNLRFFQYLFSERGVIFTMKSLLWYFLACINYFIGICYGFLIYFMEKSNFTEEREIA